MGNADPAKPLRDQLEPAFSREIIPNWQDSSTVRECSAITIAAGGPDALAKITGSSAHTRFTGAQIMKFARTEPEAYRATSRISLVSSYITTLLCLVDVKPIDESDACGMNLYDIKARCWSKQLLDTVDPSGKLEGKLGAVEKDSGAVVGTIGRWFVDRYGFNPECVVLPGTGDNPATFLSLNLGAGEGMVSLGTSDVVLVSTENYNPHPEFHAFLDPALGPGEPPRYFNMLVYKNGSLAREHVRNEYFSSSWAAFDAAVERLRPRKAGDAISATAFWWLLPDIIPAGAKGVYKYDGRTRVPNFADTDAEAFAILATQMTGYAVRSRAILGGGRLRKVFATGGAAKNQSILAVMADALGCDVAKSVAWSDGQPRDADWNACSVGVATKAAWGWARTQGCALRFDAFVNKAAERSAHSAHSAHGAGCAGSATVAAPGDGQQAYADAVPRWTALEQESLDDSLAKQAARPHYAGGVSISRQQSPEAALHPPRANDIQLEDAGL